MTSGPRVYYGPQGWLDYQAEIDEMLDGVTYEPEEFFEAPDGQIVVYMTITGVGRASGAPWDQAAAHVYELREGQVARLRVFMDRDEALEAVGLRA